MSPTDDLITALISELTPTGLFLLLACAVLAYTVRQLYVTNRADEQESRSIISAQTDALAQLTNAVERILEHQKEMDGKRVEDAVNELKGEIRTLKGSAS